MAAATPVLEGKSSGMLVAMVHAAVSIYGQRAVAEIHCQRTVAATNTFVLGNKVAS